MRPTNDSHKHVPNSTESTEGTHKELDHSTDPGKKSKFWKVFKKYLWEKVTGDFIGIVIGLLVLLIMQIRENLISHTEYAGNPATFKATITKENGKKYQFDSTSTTPLISKDQSEVNNVNGTLVYSAGLPSLKPETHILSTQKGGNCNVVFANKIKVWLNASSSLKYSTSMVGNLKEVFLSGYAHFYIPPSPDGRSGQFIIRTHKGDFIIDTKSGGSVDIDVYPDEDKLSFTLLEGKGMIAILNGKRTNVKPATRTDIENNVTTTTDLDKATIDAWETSSTFKLDDLRSFMNEVSRWYDVDIEYKGYVPDVKLGGGLSKTSKLKDILDAVEKISGVKTKLEGRKVIITN